MRFQRVELFAEISVNNILDGVIGGSVAQVISPAERRVLSSEVHLEVLEEVVVLHGGEGDEHADTTRESCVDQAVRSSRYESGLGEGDDGLSCGERCEMLSGGEENVTYMSDGHTVRLLAGPGEQAPVPQRLGPRGILGHVIVGVAGEPHEGQVAELVRHGRGRVVQRARGGHPARRRVICKSDQLVLSPSVLDKVNRFLKTDN